MSDLTFSNVGWVLMLFGGFVLLMSRNCPTSSEVFPNDQESHDNDVKGDNK